MSRAVTKPFRFSCHLPRLVADTVALDAASFGALLRLRMAYWQNGPVADDDKVLARLTGQTISEWKATRKVIIEFFDVSEGSWTCWTTDADLQEAYAAIAKKRHQTEAARQARLNKRLLCNRDSNSVSNRDSNKPLNVITEPNPAKLRQTGRFPPSPEPGSDDFLESDSDIAAAVISLEQRLASGGGK